MHTSKSRYPEWASIGVALLWQLACLVIFFALASWLWPAGLLETPLSALTFGVVVRAVVSVLFLSIGITSLYLVAVEPFLRGYAELFTRDHK